jgi:hypothetical protein
MAKSRSKGGGNLVSRVNVNELNNRQQINKRVASQVRPELGERLRNWLVRRPDVRGWRTRVRKDRTKLLRDALSFTLWGFRGREGSILRYRRERDTNIKKKKLLEQIYKNEEQALR